MVRTKASFRLIEYTSRLRIHERIYYTVDTVPVQVFHVSEIDSLLTYLVLDLLLVGIEWRGARDATSPQFANCGLRLLNAGRR